MKNTPNPKAHPNKPDDLRPEYRFDYRQARPNRFASRMAQGSIIVVLDPDVSEVFTTPESVNTALRALITAMPRVEKHRAARKSLTR